MEASGSSTQAGSLKNTIAGGRSTLNFQKFVPAVLITPLPTRLSGCRRRRNTLQAAAVKPLRLVTNEPASELEDLFQAHHGRVFRTAQRITGSAADAEDVLQTVFLRLVKGRDDYDWSRNPEAYLSRAAINASLDLLRSRTRSKSSPARREGDRRRVIPTPTEQTA